MSANHRVAPQIISKFPNDDRSGAVNVFSDLLKCLFSIHGAILSNAG